MKDIIIYHHATGKYVCIDAPEIVMWEHESLSIKKHMMLITSVFVWCYSDRKGKSYGNHSAQGIHHKKRWLWSEFRVPEKHTVGSSLFITVTPAGIYC